MTLTLSTFLIVCPLIFLAGFVDSIAGGGGLISLPAYMLAGLPAHRAIATNKLGSSMGTTMTVWNFHRNGLILWRLVPFCFAASLIGSTIGAQSTLLIDERIFTNIMLVILPLTALYLWTRPKATAEPTPRSAKGTLIFSLLAALVIGAYDGFYGPGTGTFLILALNGLARLPITQANGLAKVLNLASNLAALTVFLIHGQALLPLGLTAGAFSIAGNFLGSRLVIKGGAKYTRPIILLVLVLFFIKIIVERL